MSEMIGLDFETYGGVNLPQHGLDRYVSDETFTPILACVFHLDEFDNEVRNTFDFVKDFALARQGLEIALEGRTIVAHNAPFEHAVLKWLGIDVDYDAFIDSAVVARAAGAAGKLEAAAPQLLGTDKYEAGKQLMRLFSIPGKYQEANDSLMFDPLVVDHHPTEWEDYERYCSIDAELGYRIAVSYPHVVTTREWYNTAVTHRMNDIGWPVDVPLVEEMQRRYLDNQAKALADFRFIFETGVAEKDWLNFNSFPQLKKWCEARGVKAKSFDEEHVTLYLTKIRKRIDEHGQTMTLEQLTNLSHVAQMLETKQILGGSSLKKLQTILDQVGHDGRLRGQYLHVGAGQTFRTSGRGVQMQNLKQLREVKDMDELLDEDVEWDNEELGRNLRQVFTASHPQGRLIVGDFSSVESRGLAYLAGAEWKLDAFRKGMDMYKVLAAKIDGTPYDMVTKPRRQFGKVGELSCGYGAGGGAVQSFAKKMGTILTEGEATQLVTDWRATNPEVVALWDVLDDLLHRVVEEGAAIGSVEIGNHMQVEVYPITTPASLTALHPKAQSICVRLIDPKGRTYLSRYFHGCYIRGRNVCYYKPSDLKSGDVWRSHYRDPKTDQIRFYSIYGGKLAGILTQSMCREMFFTSLRKLSRTLDAISNMEIIGQFHDEIVVDWKPQMPGRTSEVSLSKAMSIMERAMSDPDSLKGFPLEADVKHDYRYTK